MIPVLSKRSGRKLVREHGRCYFVKTKPRFLSSVQRAKHNKDVSLADNREAAAYYGGR